MRTGVILLSLFLFPVSLFALQTQYISFEHPEKWGCENAQGTYICQSTQDPEKREALVMSVATIASDWDSLDNYLTFLKTPKTYKDDRGQEITSQISYVHRRKINGVEWIDSLQYNVELPGFWTRYLATVQNKLAILITYVVSDDYYKQMAPLFERMVLTLKPNNELDIHSSSKSDAVAKPGTEKLGKEFLQSRLNARKTGNAAPKTNPAEDAPAEGSNTTTLLVLVLGLAAIFFVIKKRKKKKTSKEITGT